MRFMMSIIPTGYERVFPVTNSERSNADALSSFNRELHCAGVLSSIEGLHASSVPAHNGDSHMASNPNNPGHDAKFWILQVSSRQEAIRWASRCPASQNEVIEVRPLHETF